MGGKYQSICPVPHQYTYHTTYIQIHTTPRINPLLYIYIFITHHTHTNSPPHMYIHTKTYIYIYNTNKHTTYHT